MLLAEERVGLHPLPRDHEVLEPELHVPRFVEKIAHLAQGVERHLIALHLLRIAGLVVAFAGAEGLADDVRGELKERLIGVCDGFAVLREFGLAEAPPSEPACAVGIYSRREAPRPRQHHGATVALKIPREGLHRAVEVVRVRCAHDDGVVLGGPRTADGSDDPAPGAGILLVT